MDCLDNLIGIYKDIPIAFYAAVSLGALTAALYAIHRRIKQEECSQDIQTAIAQYQHTEDPANKEIPWDMYEQAAEAVRKIPRDDRAIVNEFLDGIESRFEGTALEQSPLFISRHKKRAKDTAKAPSAHYSVPDIYQRHEK